MGGGGKSRVRGGNKRSRRDRWPDRSGVGNEKEGVRAMGKSDLFLKIYKRG